MRIFGQRFFHFVAVDQFRVITSKSGNRAYDVSMFRIGPGLPAFRSISPVIALLLLGAQSGMGQSSELTELLQKVAATYQGIHNYDIAVHYRRTGGKTPIQTDHIADRAFTNPAIIHDLLSPVTSIVIARSGTRFRFQSGDPSWKDPSLWITNGEITWHYLHGLNKYTEEPARPWSAPPGENGGLAGIEWRYFGRFRVVDRMIHRATLVKENVPASEVCPAITSTINLRLNGGRDATTEELHIMARTGLVCESIVRKRIKRGGRVEYFTNTNTWAYREVAGEIDPKLFLFVPPKHAKRVTNLR